ncbi:MAG: hypothetical protein ACM3US_15110 [Sphingomonadaceae bacterium]
MLELHHGNQADTGKGATDWAAIDNSLTWIRPVHTRAAHGQPRWNPSLEQELVNLYARYERACIED